eukprot:gb/GEZN01008133.1/.p1 GENE.gb/GEZN01008133.1/~~gb/GEZN01008133.1/.p1  ORF type:complete len:258 (+),score=26.07 gb/GEZN01008133.1/:484-1257(+)
MSSLDADEEPREKSSVDGKRAVEFPGPMAVAAPGQVHASDVITLDVGGTILRTRVETLTQNSGFFKDLLLDSGKISVDLSQPLFLDLDADAFGLILSYFRSKVSTPLLQAISNYHMLGESKGYRSTKKIGTGKGYRTTRFHEPTYFCRTCNTPFWNAADEKIPLPNTTLLNNNNSVYDRKLCCKKCGEGQIVAEQDPPTPANGYRPPRPKYLNTSTLCFDSVFVSVREEATINAVVYQLRYLLVNGFEFLGRTDWLL